MSRVILLTGATGFLGTQIARRLLEDDDNAIVTIVRGKDKEDASQRLARIWWDWPELRKAIGTRVKILNGDVSEPELSLSSSEYTELVKSVTHIIHTAADLRLDGPVDELRKANVLGTANVLQLARAANSDHGLVRLSHVSTAYVAGARLGTVSEDSLSDAYGFSSNYELTKFEAEKLVQAAKHEIPISVFRPALIVGDSKTGAIKNFNTVYFPIRLYLNGQLKVFPCSRNFKVNMVPVDYVAEAVTRLTFKPEAAGLNFHLTVPWENLPAVGEFLDFVRNRAASRLGVRLPRPICLPLPLAVARRSYRIQKVLRRGGKSILDNLNTLAPYFNERRKFLRDNVDRLLGPYDFDWKSVLEPALEYAMEHSFLNRTERTVHEQILFRLRSKSMPVKYHDIIEGKIVDRETEQVRNEMLQAAAALQQMGIRRGDRVAMVGLNSTRYLTLDVAIGLTGAVSVPLYYTSPPEEIDIILNDSGAKIFFVGTPKVFERLGELKSEVPIVDFCRKSPDVVLTRPVISWDQFLGMGKKQKVVPAASPAQLDSLATVRYTSGTTGQPKGVCFDHENLRWMAESTAALMPWKTRNTRVVYISQLPLNHIVEGILATYCHYYMPGHIDIYFLENLYDLPAIIRDVRPTIFFSVPRFFEKLWDALRSNRLGKIYASSAMGSPKRHILRLILQPVFLKKAGLDRCAYLITGSAPSNDNVLRNLQDLGINVHNAYGLTEAPLVTLNRAGANRIGTVGEPLPCTELAFAEDGEITVSGPQVMRGYLGSKISQPFKNGWLLTGDLGHMTEEGSLVIDGRKKELMKTSYGKYVQPAKIESLLKEIKHVDEAMVVGDGKPYCSAILWVSNQDSGLASTLEQKISELNARLSHPEQIKRWAILKNDLSVGVGLTPSLKLKRNVMMSNLAEMITALYDGRASKAGNIIAIGSARQSSE